MAPSWPGPKLVGESGGLGGNLRNLAPFDRLPSAVPGGRTYRYDRHAMGFKPSAVFANIVVGDEINRASPKTQSALLECMEGRQVTVDGTTHLLESPFIAVATQNPIEMEG